MEKVLEIAEKVSFDPYAAIFAIVNFLFIYFILSKFVFKSVGDTIHQRRLNIEDALGKIVEADAKLNSAEQDVEIIIKDAKRKAGEILQEAYAQVDVEKERLLKDAEKQAHKITEDAKKKILSERDKVMLELEVEYNSIVKNGLAKVLASIKYEEIPATDIDKLIAASREK